MPVLLADVAATSAAVTATAKRGEKVAAFADLLRRAMAACTGPDELAATISILAGAPRQGRIGVGWAGAGALPAGGATETTITVTELDRALTEVAGTAGVGSQAARAGALAALVERATPSEAELVRALLLGGMRQGALEGVVLAGVAAAADVPVAALRRATMLLGSLAEAGALALTIGAAALDDVGLRPLRAVQPMLAATSATAAEAVAELGRCVVDWKLDGARVQAHRVGDEVRLFTRNLNEMTARLPGVVAAVAALPCTSVVLDGEVLGLDEDDRPERFQDTMSRLDVDAANAGTQGGLAARWFDCLHLDGVDLLDRPLVERLDALAGLAPSTRVPAVVTDDPAEAERVAIEALAAGHEGVMVKAADSPYEAGRRGKSWRKVKPVTTLDLVVLAVEWGSGRRRGWLSNIHMGAATCDGSDFVMVGKTFKGMTDAMLAWQTDAFLAREVRREGHIVVVRPELVVEIALDGVVRSTRYPGGVALRFARVRGYREDKGPADIDTIDAVRALGGLPPLRDRSGT